MPFSAKPTGLSMATIYNGSNPAIAYANDVLATNPIAYWKLNEGSGSTITDSSGNSYDGSYTGVTWDGTTYLTDPVPFWDGANDYGDVYSAGFASAFDMDEGCILLWHKVNNSAVWTDGAQRWAYEFLRTSDNRVFLRKQTTNNTLIFFRRGGATTQAITIGSITDTDFFSTLFSWSVNDDELKAYRNGVQVGGTQTGLVASTGSGLATTAAVIGAANTTPASVWDGYLSQAIIWDSPVDASKLALATV